MSIYGNPVMLGGSGGGGAAPRLLQWLESSGTQYIDTGLIADSATDVSAIYWQDNAVNAILLGTRGTSYTDKAYEILPQSTVRIDYDSTRVTTTLSDGIHQIDIVNGSVYTDGTLLRQIGGTFATTLPQYLFAYSTPNGVSVSVKTRIYRVIYKHSSVVVRDFLPALDSNNIACMWDAVSGNFYYNIGTGTFITPT